MGDSKTRDKVKNKNVKFYLQHVHAKAGFSSKKAERKCTICTESAGILRLDVGADVWLYSPVPLDVVKKKVVKI